MWCQLPPPTRSLQLNGAISQMNKTSLEPQHSLSLRTVVPMSRVSVYGSARVEHLHPSAQNRSSCRAERKEDMFVSETLKQDPFMCSAKDLHQARTMWCQPIDMAAHTTVVHPWFWIQNGCHTPYHAVTTCASEEKRQTASCAASRCHQPSNHATQCMSKAECIYKHKLIK